MGKKVLIIGLGDLGQRLAFGVAGLSEVGELVLAGRPSEGASALATLVAACGRSRVRFTPLDALCRSAVERLIRHERPSMLVQCASLLSPWFIAGGQTAVCQAVVKAGFGAQLSAQLPIVTRLMEAVHEIGYQGPVVNCSYPDVTHPVLASRGLAPTVGIGNARMIQALVAAALREGATVPGVSAPARKRPLVRVVGHHAHVTSTILRLRPEEAFARPQVYICERGLPAHDLAYAGSPLRSDPGLNAMPAATALPIFRALLRSNAPCRVSVPGPLGLPGGYPVVIEGARLRLDLPDGIGFDAAVNFNRRSARFDGIEEVTEDGTVVYTEAAKSAVKRVAPALCEPLNPQEAEERFAYLRRRLRA